MWQLKHTERLFSCEVKVQGPRYEAQVTHVEEKCSPSGPTPSEGVGLLVLPVMQVLSLWSGAMNIKGVETGSSAVV